MKTINLIQTKTPVSPQMEMATVFLRKLSLWVLVIFVVSGTIVGGIFYYLRVRDQNETNVDQQLSQEISQSTIKEGLLLALKQRILLTNKIIAVQKPVNKLFDTVAAFIPLGQVNALSLDDNNTVLLTIHAQSMKDMISPVDALIQQIAARTLRSPQLVSLSFKDDGSIDVTVSFIALF